MGAHNGGADTPFATISAAAAVAQPGDTVLVHEGVYREQVSPALGGLNEFNRITYTVADGEHAVIKGSEVVTDWRPLEIDGKPVPGVWHVSVPNALFGNFNPFAKPLCGDWLERPNDWTMSLGEVYLDGTSMYEAPSVDAVIAAEPRTFGYGPDWVSVTEPIDDPSKTIWQWHAQVGEGPNSATEIWANFHDVNPNEHLTEINVRETCFYPERTGVNYLTVRGFEMAQAALRLGPAHRRSERSARHPLVQGLDYRKQRYPRCLLLRHQPWQGLLHRRQRSLAFRPQARLPDSAGSRVPRNP